MLLDPQHVLLEHGPALARTAAGYARPGAERDDLTQDIAIAVMQALPRFRGESGLKTYLMRIAHNVGMRHALRRRRRGEVPELDLASSDVAASPDDPESLLTQRRRSEALAAAIRTLPLGARQVLVLALEDLSHAEIAEVLGIRENAVAVRLTRARQALRAALETRTPTEEAHDG